MQPSDNTDEKDDTGKDNNTSSDNKQDNEKDNNKVFLLSLSKIYQNFLLFVFRYLFNCNLKLQCFSIFYLCLVVVLVAEAAAVEAL